MLHGGLGHSDVWGNQIPAFAEKYKVIAVDSRGHGRSTRDDKPFGYDLMTDDVVALMDKLGIPKASIVGWSDGGIIGLDMAIRHPERLDKLFAFGANYNLSGLKDGIDKDPTFNAYIERAGKDYERLSADAEGLRRVRERDRRHVVNAAGFFEGADERDQIAGRNRRR